MTADAATVTDDSDKASKSSLRDQFAPAPTTGSEPCDEHDVFYDHLDDHAIRMLSRPLSERLVAIDNEVYIGWADADAALDRLVQLLAMSPHPRRPGMLLSGEPGQGKTHLLFEAAKSCGVKIGGTPNHPEIEAIFVISVAGVESLKSFFVRIYTTMRMPVPKVCSIITICDVLQVHGVKLLVIEEGQDLQRVRGATDLELILGQIKQMTNELCRPILIIGSPEIKNITRGDKHLHSRFGKPYHLREWSSPEALRDFLYPLVAHWPFPDRSPLFDDETLLEVIRMTGGNTEHICKSFRAAARKALRHGERCISTARLEVELLEWQGVI